MKNETEKIDLTDLARTIFGGIVDYAYVQKPGWATAEGFKYLADEMAKQVKAIEPTDGFPVFIKFTNGNSIQAWSSEFGGLKAKGEEEYLEDVE